MIVDLFLMSCRIMGRYLENWILSEIKKIAITNKKKDILFEFIPTKKNKDLINIFIKLNNLKKITKKKIEEKNLKLENRSKAEYYILNTKQKITNLEIYEK